MIRRLTALLAALTLCISAPRALCEKDVYSSKSVDTLRSLGFEITPEMLREVADEWEIEVSDVYAMNMTNLLLKLGCGHYDWESGDWTPISRQIYAFDTEVFDIAQMYTLCLKGIQAIVPDAEIGDIAEDLSGLDENLDGTRSVSFLCNGHPYSVDLIEMHDWFDLDFLDFMNRVLESESCAFRLYVFDPATQDLILIYNTEDAAKALSPVVVYY